MLDRDGAVDRGRFLGGQDHSIDAERLGDLDEELVAAYLDEHWGRPYPAPPPGPYLREGHIVVAEADGEIIGMAKGEQRDGLGHVSLVYLKPEARGRGGGNELVRDLVAYFREQGLDTSR